MDQVFSRDLDDVQSFPNELLASLYGEDNFHDVTLASQDGQLVQAHKVVLSNSSSLFSSILKQNQQASPVIYCRGVNFQDIKSMLEFIYLGSTSLQSHRVTRFLRVVADFGVRGLREDELTSLTERDHDEDLEHKLVAVLKDENIERNFDEKEISGICIEDCETTASTRDKTGKEIRENIMERETISDPGGKDEIIIKEESFYSHITEGKIDPRLSQLGRFKRQGEWYLCDKCEYKAHQKKQIIMHKVKVHVKIRLECDVCESSFKDPRSLSKHMAVRHGDVKYECDLCDRITPTAFSLASHRRRKHSA